MTTIPIEAHISSEQLLRAVASLPPQELASFARQVMILKAQHDTPHLSSEESALLSMINHSLSPEKQQLYDTLVERREHGVITPDELTTLTAMTEEIEQEDAQRLSVLVQLAGLRQSTVPELIQALGIKPSTYA